MNSCRPPCDGRHHKLKSGFGVQVAAFKDYKPGGGGQEKQSGGGEPSSGKDPSKGKPETSVPKDAGSGGGDEGGEEASGGGGDFPAHTVMGLPALSPTMQQGAQCRLGPAVHGCMPGMEDGVQIGVSNLVS